MDYDFSGWASKNNILCTDGRTIMKDAFKHNDGCVVPLVWNHQHDDPFNILGHALLENRPEGVYAYCSFNDSESGQAAKLIVEHKDVSSLSIFANHIKQDAKKNVVHGDIKEVSLVLAGANAGAFIDSVMSHGDEDDTGAEAVIISSGDELVISHAESSGEKTNKETEEMSKDAEKKETLEKEKTVKDVFDSLTEEQKTVVYAMIGEALEEAAGDDEDDEDDEEEMDDKAKHSDTNNKGGAKMKRNIFDQQDDKTNTLSHADMEAIINTAKRDGSLKYAVAQSDIDEDSFAHASIEPDPYGITNIDYLFPDARTVTNTPEFISRDMGWVRKVIGGAKHLPFSRVKSVHANITMDEARARGYIKGNEKANEVFALLKRSTSPTTIYKKQKLDRDDIVDITDFDVVAWIKSEMRLMLDEEIARAALVSDGRTAGTDDKISEECIRPIWTDSDVYVVRKFIELEANETDDDKAKKFIRASVKARKDYKGSGNPTLFTTEDILTDCLLLEDGNGRVIYDTVEKLKTALRVDEIVTVPVMEGATRSGTGTDAGYDFDLLGIFVNMADYSFGADKGGAVGMFDDFDIDFNQQKYLIESRCSGALTKYHSAIVVELKKEA